MTPASNLHGNLQVKIAMKLMQLLNEGEVSAEVSIQTSKNVKVANESDEMDFFAYQGRLSASKMCPDFPVNISA